MPERHPQQVSRLHEASFQTGCNHKGPSMQATPEPGLKNNSALSLLNKKCTGVKGFEGKNLKPRYDIMRDKN